jgi:hypothetical protein
VELSFIAASKETGRSIAKPFDTSDIALPRFEA